VSYQKTTYVRITLICDVCGQSRRVPGANDVPQARRRARIHGWRYEKSGRVTDGPSKDVCWRHFPPKGTRTSPSSKGARDE
jgi:hypothetical protein